MKRWRGRKRGKIKEVDGGKVTETKKDGENGARNEVKGDGY